MSLFGQIRMYWRLASGLKGFLREPITLQQSRAIIKHRLENREQSLLTIVRRAIYGNERSPYLKLLKLSGCEYGDFERMVRSDGIEPTLRKLVEEGVYLSIEEFKCRKEVIRGRKVYKFREREFDNPLVLRQLEASTGGSSVGVGTRTFWDFNYVTLGRVVHTVCALDAFGAHNVPIVVWGPILPGWGQRMVLEYAKLRQPIAAWFSPVSSKDFGLSPKNRLGAKYIAYMGRLWGSKLPVPEYVPLGEAWRVARCIETTIESNRECYVHTTVSNAVRICLAAKERKNDIAAAKFIVTSEPITKAKRNEIESTGAKVFPRYTSVDFGVIGSACLNPIAPDNVHFLKDLLAIIQHQREIPKFRISIDPFLFTGLLLSAPKVLLNVESGDYGQIQRRNCGCYFDELGLTDHIHNIRSFDKLTSQGMTFFSADLIRILDEVIPARFGGSSIDYQMLEEEDEAGQTHLNIIASPEIGNIDEGKLVETVLVELSKGKDTQRMMAEVWSQSKTIRVKRMRPITTAGGKLLPLHIQKGNKTA